MRTTRRSRVDLFSASLSHTVCVCLYVCDVMAPADASETERSGLRHVPGAKVKGHHIQTYPEKLSMRERRGLWDHLTNTLTHNIIYYPHPLSFISPFSQSPHTLLFFFFILLAYTLLLETDYSHSAKHVRNNPILECSWCHSTHDVYVLGHAWMGIPPSIANVICLQKCYGVSV